MSLLQLCPRRCDFFLRGYSEPTTIWNTITGDSDVIKACRIVRETEPYPACPKVGESSEIEIASPMLNVFEIPNRCGLGV